MVRRKRPFLTKKQTRLIGDYTRDIFDAVGLRDWFFYLMRDPAEDSDSQLATRNDECLASIERTDGAKVAYLRLGRNFLKLEPDQQRHTIVHEALHCHLTDLNSLIQEDLAQHLDEKVHALVCKTFIRDLEYAIDGIASEFAKAMPLPPRIR